jgi:abortive infection bacteriophage resistance protein
MSYVKPWINIDEQLDQLIERGLQVSDHDKALNHLQRIGYYRLSGYWFAFRQRDAATKITDDFKAGATFQNAVDLYVFDKQLRLLAMDALERIEIAFRVDISHALGKLDTFAYLRGDLFHPTFSSELDKQTGLTKHHVWLTKHAQLISRSKEEFVNHQIRPATGGVGGVRGVGFWHNVYSFQRHAGGRTGCDCCQIRHCQRSNVCNLVAKFELPA